PQFSADGRKLYFLLRSRDNRLYVSGELWAANLETGQRERLLPHFLLQDYRVSPDGVRILFAAIDDTGYAGLWIGTLDGRTAPRRLSTLKASRVFFGAKGEVFVFGAEGESTRFVYRINEDGTGLQKAISNSVNHAYDVSPDGSALAVWSARGVEVYPVEGG